ncbi:MAG TPA: hypothetical protein DDX75_02695 [Phycisphaerales bacterium]|nr:hypothetical protein [Phycisphaerales bacterium]
MQKIYSLIIILICISISYSAQELTYLDFINSLTDLEYLATLPADGESCAQWSSYDRNSVYDANTGKYINWDYNGDGYGGAGWIRIEDEKLVLAEIKGPGCIRRIWSATPKDGHVRIYLDGSQTPAVDLPFKGYFDRKNKPFNRPALVHTVASGHNNYVPIPFQKSCKIVADKNYGEYYHFNYTLFPKDTIVPTFKGELTAEESQTLDKADALLSSSGPDMLADRYPNAKKETGLLEIAKGKTEQLIKIDGARAITSLKIYPVDMPADIEQQRKILRELTISIFWDKSSKPAVWSPLGDFFGTAPGINSYNSFPMGMTPQWFYSNWFMPFSQQAVIKITNDGKQKRQIKFEVSHTDLNKPAQAYARFHAKWHRNMFLPAEKERQIDWTMLLTQGRGRFVGVELEIWNPRGKWWGEGDEKFFVDGEKFPSTFGTGSEDYFGYAWCDPALFVNCYHNQTISEQNQGHISVNRWHIVDNIPFQKSFEGSIEKYFVDQRPTQYSCVAYWYLDSPTDQYPQADYSERVDFYTKLTYPLDVDGMKLISEPPGRTEAQDMRSFAPEKWTDDQQLWWTPEKIGDKMNLSIDAEKEGKYRILTRLTKAADYGIIQFYLNDSKINNPVDLFNKDAVITTGEIDLGVHQLQKGQNIITIEVIGANPAAIPVYMVGIDYLKIRKDYVSAGEFKLIYDPSVGENEKWYINDHCFIYDSNGQWHMFGITHAEPLNPIDEDNLAHAVSSSLTGGWQKKPFALTVDESAGETHLWAPHVIFHDGLYYMYYCAGSNEGNDKYKINLATSKNLYDWQRHPANPMVVDGYDARDPFIYQMEDKWVMYYTANSTPQGGNHVVFAVTSKDLIHWSDKKLVYTDPGVGSWGGNTESPQVIRRGKYYYLFIGPGDGYTETTGYRSTDPFNWEYDPNVPVLRTHAAEIIRDLDGSWYISHCGWGQGGVHLAPLKWNDGVNDNDTSLPIPLTKK